ncbi:MAG: ATP-binding protein [Ignavibacteriaceae bacterium]|nr:ATP-binding protein [Ignavibacteriaceae bacterium]
MSIVKSAVIPKEHADKYTELDGENLKQSFLKDLNKFIEDECPTIVYWEYESKYLVPSEITYDELMLNNKPYENSIPLFNIFILSKRLNIEDEVDLADKIVEWKADSSARRRDASIINDGLNKYIKNIWADYDQELYIELEETKITIHINDPKSSINNFYEMEDRSQGFKTFISFILTIAAEAETQSLNNFILLLDEPETHLHPKWCKIYERRIVKTI